MATPQAEKMQLAVAGEVRAWLARRQRSGRSAARALGWTEPYLSRRLTGTVPFDVPDLSALADLLDVPIGTFFDFPEEDDSPPGGPGVLKHLAALSGGRG